MKQILGMFLSAVVLSAGLFLLASRQRPAWEPDDLVDLFVDAGMEFSASPVEAGLLEHRKIVIGTDINPNTVQRVVRALLLLDALDCNRPIDLYIRTEGGRIDDAFAIVNVIQSLKAPVNTYAIGGTHSSGAMILAAGTGVRYAYPYSSIMFHAGLYEGDGDHGQNTMDNRRLIAFWERHARVPPDWLHSKIEKTYFVGPEKAVELGFVDRIYTKTPDLQGRAIRESLSRVRRSGDNR
jgi:ATP-dependent Clp protease protease subunit